MSFFTTKSEVHKGRLQKAVDKMNSAVVFAEQVSTEATQAATDLMSSVDNLQEQITRLLSEKKAIEKIIKDSNTLATNGKTLVEQHKQSN